MSVCTSICTYIHIYIHMYVCTYVCPSTESFSDSNDIWYHIGRGRWVMNDGMPYGPIQGQGQGHVDSSQFLINHLLFCSYSRLGWVPKCKLMEIVGFTSGCSHIATTSSITKNWREGICCMMFVYNCLCLLCSSTYWVQLCVSVLGARYTGRGGQSDCGIQWWEGSRYSAARDGSRQRVA